jgi:hypothetical protein
VTEDLTKLPKWAQQRFRFMESNLDAAERKIAEMIPTGDETNVFIISGMDLIPLPKRTQIRFVTPSGHIDVGMRSDLPDGVCVYGNERDYNKRIAIRPQASNCFHVCFKEAD